MKLQDYREDFYTYSGKASDVNRQLAFAAIAIIWIFKKDVAGQLTVPQQLLVPGMLIVAALALDLLHYISAAITWYLFYRYKEKVNTPEDREIDHSIWLVVPLNLMFGGKIILVMLTYVLIFKFLLKTIILTSSL
jgi:hypothetical protein